MFLEIKFKSLSGALLPADGISVADVDSCSDGPPFVCQMCTDDMDPTATGCSFSHKPKLLVHYALQHRQPFCSTCCTVFGTERDRMTHENRAHWPFRCPCCRTDFFQPTQLEQHMRLAHGRRTCDLCDTMCAWSADDADATEYEQHLRLQHHCIDRQFQLAVAAPIIVAPGSGERKKPITRFRCRLCASDKLFANFHGHYLNHHKVRLNKFLALALQFAQSNDEFLHRIGATEKTPSSSAPDGSGPKKTFKDVADNFEVSKRDSNDGTTTTSMSESRMDFNTSLVQFVASTDGESTTEDDDDGATPAIVAVIKDRRRLGCPYCDTTSVFDRGTLGKHLQAVHGFQVRNFEYRCHRCRRAFSSRLSLQHHRQIVHADDWAAAGSWCCTFCEQSQGSRKALRIHIRQHIDRHDYPCPPDRLAFCCRFCPDRFWIVDQLNAHQNARHHMQMSNAELLLCGHCGITASSKSYLSVHTAEAHASLTQIAGVVFKCGICLIAHSTLADLRQHMLVVHPAELSEFCALANCRQRIDTTVATSATALEQHMVAQHGDQVAYTCKVCGHRLLSKHGALKHFRVKHG